MQKIPTIFVRDWNGDRSKVTEEINTECEWVFNGEGVATRKIDGTCCMIRDGKLYKRHEVKNDKSIPIDFEQVQFDTETGKIIGWRPVGDRPEDKWHRLGFENLVNKVDGTYELVGPHTQKNPEKYELDILVPHTIEELTLKDVPPRNFYGLKGYLADRDIEGIVFHHPDGRYAKIKKRDFGFKR